MLVVNIRIRIRIRIRISFIAKYVFTYKEFFLVIGAIEDQGDQQQWGSLALLIRLIIFECV